ncbi:Uncharacterised protein [Mycobacteroides abscessus subsp. abscessus]|nr:Uncharacterised protein [Mycobacteroides abscessus subsp. abscessus]
MHFSGGVVLGFQTGNRNQMVEKERRILGSAESTDDLERVCAYLVAPLRRIDRAVGLVGILLN